MEFGPRALGGRSILADPRRPDVQRTINERIKRRESFRPFAPAILEERTGDYFDETWPSPFMMLVYGTRPKGRDDIQATDHVDHTGRLQTVSRATSPRYYKLISSFEKLTAADVRTGDIARMLQNAYVSPVLTAHPTEVQRKSILDAERAIAELVAQRDQALSPRERAENEALLRGRITQLWQTRMLRYTKLTVADEIDNALS